MIVVIHKNYIFFNSLFKLKITAGPNKSIDTGKTK